MPINTQHIEAEAAAIDRTVRDSLARLLTQSNSDQTPATAPTSVFAIHSDLDLIQMRTALYYSLIGLTYGLGAIIAGKRTPVGEAIQLAAGAMVRLPNLQVARACRYSLLNEPGSLPLDTLFTLTGIRVTSAQWVAVCAAIDAARIP